MAIRLKRFVGFGFLGIIALGIIGLFSSGLWRAFAGPKARTVTNRTYESTPARLERGKYLVENVSGCFFCHSERDWKAEGAPPIEARKGAGTAFPGGPGKLFAPNITPDKETGVGNWTDDELARAIREGVSRDGHALFPIMPYMNYRKLPDEDLAAVVVYLRSIPAVKNAVEKTKLSFPLNFLVNMMPQPLEGSVPAPDMSSPVKRGEHLVTLNSCNDCHTPTDGKGQPLPGMFMAGGFTFNEPSGETTSANLTPDASGISYYDEALFLEVMRTGKVKARQLNPTMPWVGYGKMTDEDLKAIFTYLKSIPAVSHKVDNTEPPTPCKICKGKHGFGDRN
ncbi:MAG: c-type cytochrome [Acidobacteria bacterium]|nr:c-type cytochrome [Acidobacteriota bacterium]